MNQIYLDTARLLTQVAPLVFVDDTFALKGGTAINLFIRDMPRLSVDLDLVMRGTVQPVRRAALLPRVHEVLFSAQRDIAQEFERNFQGMTTEPVALNDLLATRDRMMRELQTGLDANERRFLLTLVINQPDWPLLNVLHARELPGVRWKLHNLGQLQKANPKKFAEQSETLARLLKI